MEKPGKVDNSFANMTILWDDVAQSLGQMGGYRVFAEYRGYKHDTGPLVAGLARRKITDEKKEYGGTILIIDKASIDAVKNAMAANPAGFANDQ